jgi:hypothetical protein
MNPTEICCGKLTGALTQVSATQHSSSHKSRKDNQQSAKWSKNFRRIYVVPMDKPKPGKNTRAG